jgi:hypothetical protein
MGTRGMHGSRSLQAALAVMVLFAGTGIAGAAAPDERRRAVDDDVADTPIEGHAQHGGTGGHLAASSANVELVGKLTLSGVVPGRISDVGTLGDYAYLGAFNEPCGSGGVYVVDISHPASPVEVGFIPTASGSFVGEGVQALSIKTKAFKGDILVINNEICELTGSQIGGVSIYDITNPLSPVPLVVGAGDTDPGGAFSDANQIHSAFAWQQGKRAYVVIVDDEEFEDVDIFDITDPSSPVAVAQVSLADWPDAQDAQADGMGNFAGSFLHDMVVKKVKGDYLMLLSYWDAGYIVLNVNDPAHPVFVNDTTFTEPDPETGLSPEGNAHQAEWSYDNKFILGTDEDFSPFRVDTFTITSGSNANDYPATSVGGAAAPTILSDGRLNGPIVYGGYGCSASAAIPPRATAGLPPLAPGEEAIVVLQRGPTNDPSAPEAACFPGEKAANAIAAGYDAVVLVNRHIAEPEPLPPFCGSGGFPATPPIVAVCTTHDALHKMFNTTPDFSLPYPPEPNTEPDIGTLGEYVDAAGTFDGWGYVHLFNAKTLAEIDTYAIPEALDPAFADDFGALSVHEVATDPEHNIAYVSYYAGGFRVLKFGKRGIEEVGHFIDTGGNDFWGVQLVTPNHHDDGHKNDGHHDDEDHPLILASDRDSGLYIFRYTGDD